jgi:ketosteroid isomerase-like protein
VNVFINIDIIDIMIHFKIKNYVLITAISFILLLTGCGQPKVNFKEEQEKITFAWTDWSKKALTGKPDSLAYYYADDALIIGTDPELIKGKAEATKIYANAPTNFELEIKWDDEEKPNIIQFSNDGSMAYSLDGNAVPIPDSTGTIHMIRNKVLHLWKKDKEGNWRVSLLMVYPER